MENIKKQLEIDNNDSKNVLDKINNSIEKLVNQFESKDRKYKNKDLIKQNIKSKIKMKKNLQNIINRVEKKIKLINLKIDKFFEDKRFNNVPVSAAEISKLTKLNF